jgi:ribosome-associated protein YbcJ (S4-like RNA binding protein)
MSFSASESWPANQERTHQVGLEEPNQTLIRTLCKLRHGESIEISRARNTLNCVYRDYGKKVKTSSGSETNIAIESKAVAEYKELHQITDDEVKVYSLDETRRRTIITFSAKISYVLNLSFQHNKLQVELKSMLLKINNLITTLQSLESKDYQHEAC